MVTLLTFSSYFTFKVGKAYAVVIPAKGSDELFALYSRTNKYSDNINTIKDNIVEMSIVISSTTDKNNKLHFHTTILIVLHYSNSVTEDHRLPIERKAEA